MDGLAGEGSEQRLIKVDAPLPLDSEPGWSGICWTNLLVGLTGVQPFQMLMKMEGGGADGLGTLYKGTLLRYEVQVIFCLMYI